MLRENLTYTVSSGVGEVFVMAQDAVEARRAYIRSVRDSFQEGGQGNCGSRTARLRAPDGTAEDIETAGSGSLLKARLLLSAFLFAAFVFCDRTGEKLLTLTTEEICEKLAQNYDYTNLEKYVMMASDAVHKEVEDEPSGVK